MKLHRSLAPLLRRVMILALVFAIPIILPKNPIKSAFTVPVGFTDSLVANISTGTAMEFAPDGRLFVCQQGGALRVIKNGSLLTTPFLTLTVDSSGERGLLGVAFDPNFPSAPYVYVYYTTPSPSVHNRVSRFTASGDVSAANSEVVLLELDNLSAATNHNGGAIHFGLDGHLYIAVGDNANPNNAETLNSLFGKILRIQKDGTIPLDNPFNAQTTGNRKSIWAMGLRNPFTFSVQPATTRMFINDVGQGTTEEINDGIAGSDYGWNTCEGPCNPPNANFRDPIHWYANDANTCAITGGAFYNPVTTQFPASYVGTYFFADFCGGWIRNLDPSNGNSVSSFATSISSAVDLKVSSSGSLFYLTRSGGGSVRRIDYPANMIGPTIDTHPENQTTNTGQSATFSVSATGPSPFTYQWQRNNVDIPGATGSSYTLTNVQPAETGATFRAIVTNAFGSATSNSGILTVNIIPLEGDVAPRFAGDGSVVVSDWVQTGRFSVGLDTPSSADELQRADTAPKATLGDGQITVADWVQAGRYSVGLDASTGQGGPTSSGLDLALLQNSSSQNAYDAGRHLRRVRIAETRIRRGTVASMMIELEGFGDECALAFTLSWDPRKATLVEARLAEDALGAVLAVNQRKAIEGRLGVALTLPPERSFGPGLSRVLSLQFLANGGDGSDDVEIAFDDSVIPREIVDIDARTLHATVFENSRLHVVGKSLAVVSAAGFTAGALAPEGIASAFGTRLAVIAMSANVNPLPMILGSTRVEVQGSDGVERSAPLFFVSEDQVNFQIPKGTPEGAAVVIVLTDGEAVSRGGIVITNVAPTFFTHGWIAAGQIHRIGPDGSETYEPLSQRDESSDLPVPIPLDLADVSGQPRLILYGTGFRNRESLSSVKVSIGGLPASVEYAGAHGSLTGLDQLNVVLPSGLSGRGDVMIEVEVEGISANQIGVRIK